MTKSPAISVVIPMYNAGKYIGECLESLLAQTFQGFEVIVVDDCSTDNSVAVVESYTPKFNGRLKLSRLEKNTGNGVAGRNRGLNLSRGEYIFNMDNDDLLTLTALEELYTLAKNFDADVVYCEKYFVANVDLSEIFVHTKQRGSFVDKPTFETENLAQRIQKIILENFSVTPWSKLIRRDLLIENEISFPPLKIADDDIWTYEILFCTKKFLRVPNVVYINRQTEGSIMRKKKSPQETINFWLNPIVLGIKTLDDFISRIEFFQNNPQYRCAMLEQFVHLKLAQLFKASLKMSTAEIYAAIKDNFGGQLGDYDVLISWLLADLITQQKNFAAQQISEEKSS